MNESRKLISLFSGAGGLDLGLEQAGFKTVVATELEAHACETLRTNKHLCNLNGEEVQRFISEIAKQRCFGAMSVKNLEEFFSRITKRGNNSKFLQDCEVIEGDIRLIPSDRFRAYLDGERPYCVAGGPPCQPFSKAGKQRSFDCTKNGDLFFEFVRIVDDLRPKWFLFENVKGITFTKTDVVYKICSACGKKDIAPFRIRQDFQHSDATSTCEYCSFEGAHWETKNESGGSLKIILNEFNKLGYKCTSKVLNAADFGAPQIRERLFIVGNRDGVEFTWPVPSHEKKDSKSQLNIDLFDSYEKLLPWSTMRETLWPIAHSSYGKFSDRARLWVKNVVRPHDEPVTWNFDRPSPTIGAHQAAKLAFAPYGVPEAQLFRQQWATKGRKQGDTPPVDVEHAYLTDEELLKLQTFPAWWYLHGTRMQRAFQIGNAVPPLLAKVMGEAIIRSGENKA